jgi:hypothetical protein
LQRKLVLQSTVMWTDDTPVTVIGGLQGSFQGHFWTYIGHERPYSVYDFTKSRSRDGPAKFLPGFTGYLHAMLSPVMTRSFLVRTRPSKRWLVGRMRGGNSSMP